ncbi:MAG: sugar nucleotide-binding protein [Psychroflexus sp.]|nr:sugar nucleotide-binding protein [Psychroflexus sp.]
MKAPNNCTVGILGCGWLGQALAKTLNAKSYTVKGTTTQKEKLKVLNALGIEANLVKIYPDHIKGDLKSFLKHLDILIIAIPPKINRGETNLKNGLENIFQKKELSAISKLIYVSSTGVFANGLNQIYDEKSTPNNKSLRGKALISLENTIRAQNQIQDTFILRLGGLFENGGRHPIHFLSGKPNVPNPKAPINLIEKTDAVGLIVKIIETKAVDQSVFHGVFPKHPERETYYIDKAKALYLKPPLFENSSTTNGKIIKSDLTQEVLDFTYTKEP